MEQRRTTLVRSLGDIITPTPRETILAALHARLSGHSQIAEKAQTCHRVPLVLSLNRLGDLLRPHQMKIGMRIPKVLAAQAGI